MPTGAGIVRTQDDTEGEWPLLEVTRKAQMDLGPDSEGKKCIENYIENCIEIYCTRKLGRNEYTHYDV